MLSGQRAVAHVLKRVYGCRYVPIKYIQTYVPIYVCMTALFNICYACTCANIRLSRTVCICIHTHAHTHSVSCATVCRICICLSVATTSPLSLPLQNLHPHTVGAYRHPVRAVNRLSVCSRCRL